MRSAIGLAAVGLGAALLAQEPQTPTFRVGVDAVRIDAVVTDKSGNIVRDLTADDFEILQDKKPQKVTFAQFVPILTAAAAAADAPLKPTKTISGAPALPSAQAVRRENIQRTIALVVDDLGLSIESLYYAKRGLHEFIDKSMQPGDLVALVRTGGSMEGLQPFTTDRRVLHVAVDNLKWNTSSRSGVEAFDPVNLFPMMGSEYTTMSIGDFTTINSLRADMAAAGTLGALNLAIQGTRNLPGRKAILFVSEGFKILEKDLALSGKARSDVLSPSARVRGPLDRAIDQATRAGVVIYSIDARGLQTGGMMASDNFNCHDCTTEAFQAVVRDKATERNGTRRDTQEGMAYLAEQTGGFAVLNSNNLAAGLARAAEDVRDYYIIGYVPETSTFAAEGKTPEYHKVDVRVKRPGLKVRTRREFLGVSDVDQSEASVPLKQQLVNAATSPFTATDIALAATTLPAFDATRGLFVRALLHIDARALTFVKGEDGKSTASADVLGMVFDRDGTEVAHLSTAFEAALTGDAAEDALRDGLAYTLRVPIPRAGPYQVRFAVRDRQSGKVGTAGQFVEVPDVPHGVFALSGIVLRAAQDAAVTDADRVMISPAQALRVYARGVSLKYACEIYNASGPVQLAISVWRGTERVLNAAPDTLTPPATTDHWFAAGGAFKLGDALPPGHYVLQVAAVSPPPGSGRINRAVQMMDFEVK